MANDLAHQLALCDVHLSMENARELEQMNNRWKQLQVYADNIQSIPCLPSANNRHYFRLNAVFFAVLLKIDDTKAQRSLIHMCG